MQELVLVKLGGSVLTDKTRPEALNQAVLQGVVRDLLAIKQERPGLRLVLGHGGGSFGHFWAQRYGTQHGVNDRAGWLGFARVEDAQGRLNRLVVAALIDVDLPAVGLQPSAGAVAEGGALLHWSLDALRAMVERDVVPVIYGDAVVDQRQGAAIVSTEQLFAYLAPRLAAQRIVLVGEGGVYSADPRQDVTARLVSHINEDNIAVVLGQAGGSHGVDVTGGMATKVATMWDLARQVPGLRIHLIAPSDLRSLFQGKEPGTLIEYAGSARAIPQPAS